MPDDMLCARCGRLKSEHRLVNYADGDHVGVSWLVCPTAIFDAVDGPHAHANAVAGEVKKHIRTE